ncbi:hypothetical protein NUU61_005384 [Penicillium alfredii]|uniref:LPXTG-domain-containing protein n=1 Tax=Penicillium alfredii TaxID=1506179 RepID=A0A9W9K7J3_9EURO|nr:uncharacterized protein NUU61_005384 [Penicillium alfredii]KAJ5096028.1 hypothetical protein NUU61_005384 [Penicillium alfredii]
MLGLWDGGFIRSRLLALVLTGILLSRFFPAVDALRTAEGSPCADVCHKSSSNTTSSEIACLDASYNATKGRTFEKCVDCQLRSTYDNPSTGESDVNWGLYNLRYAFSTCVYGFPHSVSNVSSPCPVACDGIRPAIEFDLTNPSSFNFDAWCSTSSFADNIVNTCEFCYNLTTTQVYLANFLESIRYNCHFRTTSGKAFDIAPSRIFTQVLLPSSMSLTTSTPGGSNVNLPLVIALPILGFIIILCALTICCFFFIRHRRKRMRRNRHHNHLYNRWNDTTISTPKQGNSGWPEQQYPFASGGYGPGFSDSVDTPIHAPGPWAEQQMHAPGGYGNGLGFMDNDGRTQQLEYGYYQSGLAHGRAESPAVHPQAVPLTGPHAVEPEKHQNPQ